MPATKRSPPESGDEGDSRPSKRRILTVDRVCSVRNQEPVTWKSLPAEIISHIVQSLAPGPFELRDLPERPLVGGFQHAPNWEEYRANRNALVALCGVSKALRDVAMPLLYENVLVAVQGLSAFYKTLVRFPERGRFVREITYSLFPWRVTAHGVPRMFGSSAADLLIPRFKLKGVRETPYDGPLDYIRSTVEQKFRGQGLYTREVTAALLLPVMALTPSLTNLNIAGFRDWMIKKTNSMDIYRDILFGIFLRTESAGGSWVFGEVFRDLFPQDVFGLDQSRFGTAPVFPPPSFKLVNILALPADSPTNLVTNRVTFFKPWACHQLRSITESMETDLAIPHDEEGYLCPSRMLGKIHELELSNFLAVGEYIKKIGELKEDFFPTERYQAAPSEKSSITQHRNLDLVLRKSGGLVQDFIMVSQDVAWDLRAFHFLGQYSFPLSTQVTSLTIHDTYTGPDRFTFHWTEDNTLQTIIQTHFRGLKVLDLNIHLKKDVRSSILGHFDPGQFDNVETLSLTTEILWGPLRPAMEMLHVKESDMAEQQSPEFLQAIDGLPVLDVAGNRIPVPDVWSKQAKAIRRIPLSCTNICIRDWFAEYEPIVGPRDPLELVGYGVPHLCRTARTEMRQEIETAVLNNTLLLNPALVPKLRKCIRMGNVIAHIYRTHEDETVCYYPTVKGDACFDSNPLCKAEEVDSFIDMLIHNLCSGLKAMCVHRGKAPGPAYQASALPAIMEIRRNLKKISFVYTLHSKLPGRENDLHAHFADLKWRMWYHGGLEHPGCSCGLGYARLRQGIKEGSGIDFELWEDAEGVVPLEPIWPDKIKAKAASLGILLNDDNRMWEDREAERRKKEAKKNEAVGGHSYQARESASSSGSAPTSVENVTWGIADLGLAGEAPGDPMDID